MSASPRGIEIVPSVLPADFARLGEECQALEAAGADRIQWDVMDGQFVPNITIGPDVIAAIRPLVSVPFEAHLMVNDPDHMLGRWVDAGCEVIIVHAESTVHLHKSLTAVSDLGARAAVAINPSTPVDAIRHILDLVDMVLVMTINPGFGGQSYLPSMEPKLRELRQLVLDEALDIDIEVDGGVNTSTIADVAAAGANVLVSGSALFRYEEGLAFGIADLRSRAEAADRR
ncbi:MAG: ribulose-phosphate 3-epimerase [Acidimicrobiia bacterium]|nr:ribulose-phosphate 3-epimerase [Acidimicrobiia bacterium]